MMNKTIELVGLWDALEKKAGIGDTILDWMDENPTATGALLGGGLGASGGALFSDEGNKLKNALLGGLAGAGIGGLGGYAIGNRRRRKKEQESVDRKLEQEQKERDEAAARETPEERSAREAAMDKRRQRGEDARKAYNGDAKAAKRLKDERKENMVPTSFDMVQQFEDKLNSLSRRADKFRDPNFIHHMTPQDREEMRSLQREADLLVSSYFLLQQRGVKNLPPFQDVVSRIVKGYSSPTPVQGNDAGRLINAVREANGMGPVDLNRTGTPVDNL